MSESRQNLPKRRKQTEKPIPLKYKDSRKVKKFASYANELDEYLDKRERIIKLSREITMESKKIIFTLHRIVPVTSEESLGEKELEESNAMMFKQADDQIAKVMAGFKELSTETPKHDFYKFYRSCSICLQEFVEAVVFYSYLKSGSVISYPDLCVKYDMVQLDDFATRQEDKFHLPVDDYVLGVADFTGELMRFAINLVGKGKWDVVKDVCQTLSELSAQYDTLNSRYYIHELGKKINTMQQSLSKVEDALCNVTVLKSEYPPELLAQMISMGSDGALNQEIQ
ncbi:hypothetical protein MP638_006973 [Amoeboaphelidium occidentale]|nr:hypothetical protein MP638_006973 [Amoeboaphelidium occidentale]